MKKAFTLIELLVVIAVIALLMGVLIPSVLEAKEQGRAVVCRSNIRQILLANMGYASENNDEMVLASADIYGANLQRWHGKRETLNDPFAPSQGDLAPYLGEGKVKECPNPVGFRHGDPWDLDFEDGCGGYGYNDVYLGSRAWDNGSIDEPTKITEVRSPAGTVMFADTAMSKLDNGIPYYLEYSFIKPRYWFHRGQLHTEWGDPSPSIHFRHREQANVAWADGHIGSENIAEFHKKNAYGVRSIDMQIGWFEPLDNSLFDLK